MKDPLLVDALRARDPGAPAALYDTHGENLFRYCWFMLRSRDAAQVALRDTLVLADAHIDRLRHPSMLRPWLYALARAECGRRQDAAGGTHDAIIARPDQPDADRRLIAWQAVMSLGEAEREGLELTLRHGMDPATAALALGLQEAALQAILARGRADLEEALAGEILARHGVLGCPQRAALLTGWAGELTKPLRGRLVEHARDCAACRKYLPRNVSAVKVFSLLPAPVPPQAMRLRVMTCFTDPELVGYRMFVAAKATGFNDLGFPDTGAAAVPAVRRGNRMWTSGPAAAAVAVVVMIAAVFALSRLGGGTTPVQRVSAAAGQPGVTSPATSPQPTTGRPSSAAPGQRPAPSGPRSQAALLNNTEGPGAPTRLFLRATPAPSSSPTGGKDPGTTGPPAGQLSVSPGELALGPQSTGQVTLTATGAAVNWTAASSSSAIALSSTGGTVTPGSPVTVTVTIDRADGQAGQGTISFSPGGSVSVHWSAPATSPPPSSPPPTSPPSSPTPTPTGTTHPSSPTPTPTATATHSPPPSISPSPVQSVTPTPSPTPTGS